MKKEEVFCENCKFFYCSIYLSLETCRAPGNQRPLTKGSSYYRNGLMTESWISVPKDINKNTSCTVYKEKPKKKKNWWDYLTSKDRWSCY